MEKTELTCVVCPVGCRITVTTDGGRVFSVEGNTCPRGKAYAENEVTRPCRTLTSTVPCRVGEKIRMLPVRTDRPIPKASLLSAMKEIHKLRAAAPVKTGDVICADFIISGVNLIAAKDIK